MKVMRTMLCPVEEDKVVEKRFIQYDSLCDKPIIVLPFSKPVPTGLDIDLADIHEKYSKVLQKCLTYYYSITLTDSSLDTLETDWHSSSTIRYFEFEPSTLLTCFIEPDKSIDSEEYSKQELVEEVVTGDEAVLIYDLLMNPPEDPERIKFIEEALQEFPEPDKPSEVDIDL